MTNSVLLSITTSMFYGLATLLLSIRFSRRHSTQSESSGNSHLFAIIIALLLHALLLGRLMLTPTGINFGFSNSLTLLSWMIAAASIFIGVRNKLEFMGLLVFPVCIISIVLSFVFPSTYHHPIGTSALLKTHITLSIIAYCLLSIAALIAIVLAVQDHQLHKQKTGILNNSLPPLQTTEKLMFNIISFGFLTLTAALITGFMFANDWVNHKTIFSCTAWAVFLILLTGRHLAGWRGRTAIRWTLAGIVILMLAFFGTKIVLELILHRQ